MAGVSSLGEPMFVHLPVELDIASLLPSKEQASSPCAQLQPGALFRAICKVPPITNISCPPGLGPPDFPRRVAFAGLQEGDAESLEQKAHIKLAPSSSQHFDAEAPEPKAPQKLTPSGCEQSDVDGSVQKPHKKIDSQEDCFDSVSDTQQPWGASGCDEETVLEEALLPVLRSMLLRENPRKAQQGGSGNNVRWWTRPSTPLLCPLTRFPICLLPYPPFKLRMDPKRSSPHRLVDGKFLAMSLVVSGSFTACGRKLQASDLSALDEYVHRCKLGPYRPVRAAALREKAEIAATAEDRAKAAEELKSFIDMAKVEMGKLRRIQDNRITQINKSLPSHIQALLKGPDMKADSECQAMKARGTGTREHSSSFASDSTCCSSSASDVSQE